MTKEFKTHEQQIEILKSRGMVFKDDTFAIQKLKQLGYYRLSGYWYRMRQFGTDNQTPKEQFNPDTTFELVIQLYEFDEHLRHLVLAELAPVEQAIRALIGYELGKVDRLAHLNAHQLGPNANDPTGRKTPGSTAHEDWLQRYHTLADNSREDFVKHHKDHYNNEIPIWAAVELMDWGTLSHLYRISPQHTRNTIAKECGLTAAQLGSWLKSLNVLRNLAAHHARLFNRVYDIKPKSNKSKMLSHLGSTSNRLFGQLTLILYLKKQLNLPNQNLLLELLTQYPENRIIPISSTGTPPNWQSLTLWRK